MSNFFTRCNQHPVWNPIDDPDPLCWENRMSTNLNNTGFLLLTVLNTEPASVEPLHVQLHCSIFTSTCIRCLRKGNGFSRVCLSVSLSTRTSGPTTRPVQTCLLSDSSAPSPNHMPLPPDLLNFFRFGPPPQDMLASGRLAFD